MHLPDPETDLEAVDHLVFEALALPRHERKGFVAARCAGNPALLREASSLLDLESRVIDQLGQPLFDLHRQGSRPGRSSPGPETFGPYRVEERIGQGGLATVYRARRSDGKDPRPVALKVLRSGLDGADLISRFQREGEILAGLRHPGIAQLFGGGFAEDGRPYLVMELIEGEGLSEYLERTSPSLERRIELFLAICECVAYAHARLVVHRDLKPANLLVDGRGRPRLLDFGISKLLDPATARPVTRTVGLRWLTPEYASPEQIRRQPVTIATDIYSLGVVLHEMLSGTRPFSLREDSEDWWRVVCETEPEPPSRCALREGRRGRARRLRGDLDAIVDRCLRKEPEQRFASVEQLMADLRRYLGGLPVEARRGSRAYRIRKFLGRHRLALIAASLVLLLVAGFVVDRESQRHRLIQERDQAREVREFLVDIFRSASPEAPLRSDVTLRSIVDLGVQRFEGLRSSPRLRGELMGTLGDLYTTMGAFEEAQPLLRESRRIAGAASGASDRREILRADLRLARLAYKRDQAREAARILEPLVRDVRGLEDARLEARATGLLGRVMRELGDLDAAESYLRDAVEQLEEVPEQRAELGEARLQLAKILRLRGHLDPARTLLRQAMDDLEAVAGPDHYLLAQGYNDLALLLYQNGDLDGSERSFRRAYQACRRALGEGHPDTLGVAGSLAAIYVAQMRIRESEQLLRRTVEHWSAEAEHDLALGAFLHWNLGVAEKHLGRPADAESTLRRALDMRTRVLGEEHFETARLRSDIGLVLIDLGRLADAERELARSRELIVRGLGEENPETYIATRKLLEVWMRQGRLQEATAGLRELLEKPSKPAAEGALRRILLARALLTSAPAEAAGLLRPVLSGDSPLAGAPSVHPAYVRALAARARLLAGGGDPATERRILEEAAVELAARGNEVRPYDRDDLAEWLEASGLSPRLDRRPRDG